MTLQRINPSTIARPASRYSQATLIPANAKILHVSGQLGMTKDGTLLDGFAAQMEQAMANIFAILEDVGMTSSDIVKLSVFATSACEETVSAYREIRDRMLGEHAPAALFAAVTGFTHPDFLVEIEAVAAA